MNTNMKEPLSQLDIQNLINLALQNKIPWDHLAILLSNLSTDESNTVIGILLNELKAFQQRLKENQNYDNHFIKEVENNAEEIDKIEHIKQDQIIELQNDSIKQNSGDITSEDDSTPQMEEIHDRIKETSNEDVQNHSFMIDGSKGLQNDELERIDNEWYTFISNERGTDSVSEKQVEHAQIETVEIEETGSINTNERKYQCNTCNKHFNHPSSLSRHKIIHSGEIPYDCKICKRRFNQLCNLKMHERIHSGEVPFECNYCKKRFSALSTLKNHERIHTGEMPFECTTCKKRFKTKGEVKVHERIHTGEVPYQCETCNKRFSRVDTLKNHERIHTGEEPYECKTCNKRFKQSSTLKCHEKRH